MTAKFTAPPSCIKKVNVTDYPHRAPLTLQQAYKFYYLLKSISMTASCGSASASITADLQYDDFWVWVWVENEETWEPELVSNGAVGEPFERACPKGGSSQYDDRLDWGDSEDDGYHSGWSESGLTYNSNSASVSYYIKAPGSTFPVPMEHNYIIRMYAGSIDDEDNFIGYGLSGDSILYLSGQSASGSRKREGGSTSANSRSYSETYSSYSDQVAGTTSSEGSPTVTIDVSPTVLNGIPFILRTRSTTWVYGTNPPGSPPAPSMAPTLNFYTI
jgi:hypothetical protein